MNGNTCLAKKGCRRDRLHAAALHDGSLFDNPASTQLYHRYMLHKLSIVNKAKVPCQQQTLPRHLQLLCLSSLHANGS